MAKHYQSGQQQAYIAIPLMIAVIVATNIMPEEICIRYRVIFWGIPGALLLMSAISLETRFSYYLKGLPNLIGNASYAIYLIHGFILPLIGVVFLKLSLDNMFWKYFAILLCMAGSVIAGIIIHLWIEIPLGAYLRNIGKGKNNAA